MGSDRMSDEGTPVYHTNSPSGGCQVPIKLKEEENRKGKKFL